MSKFNTYAQKVDELARKVFEEYAAAADALKKADADRENNPTMIRLVASYAAKAAEGLTENNGRVSHDRREEWSRLNAVGQQGAAYTSRAKLQEFDALADVFKRTMRNPGMIGSWDMLTGNIVESF